MTRYPSLDSGLKSDKKKKKKKHKNTRRNKSKSEKNLNLGVENKQLFFKELSISGF